MSINQIFIDEDYDMPQHKKDYKLLNCKIEKAISDELEKFTANTGLSKTATVEKALKMYLAQFNKTGKI